MLIDWFTVGAQVLNFLILVWLLKHFLYQPVLDTIDSREEKVAAELADAETKRTEAKKERDDFQQKNETFDQERAALLTKATAEVSAERQRLLDEARAAADAMSTKRQDSLRTEARSLNQSITRRAQDEVFAIARRALAELADSSVEARMSDVFIRRLRAIEGEGRTTLATALTTMSVPAVVRSAFDLPEDERAKIRNAINETFSADIPLRFETVADVVSGIELKANGQKVAWSIAEYLTSLEKGVGELLKDQSDPEPAAEPEVAP